ncbi:hypothetical protein E4U11_002087 [Claviceps purpurea]|nr:hypothetical protein E4U11_002087 [Claviceps purpurea]
MGWFVVHLENLRHGSPRDSETCSSGACAQRRTKPGDKSGLDLNVTRRICDQRSSPVAPDCIITYPSSYTLPDCRGVVLTSSGGKGEREHSGRLVLSLHRSVDALLRDGSFEHFIVICEARALPSTSSDRRY